MAITKEIAYDGSFLEDGQIQARQITRLIEDGVVLSETYERHVIDVGDDVTNEAQVHKDIAGVLHTPERKAARDKVRAAQAAKDKP